MTALAGLLAPPARAMLPADSVGIYSEELERANSPSPLAAGQAQRDAGIGLVRQPFLWTRLERAPGVLDFSVYDDVVAAAAIAGLALLPVLTDSPPWRSTGPPVAPGEDMYPPRDVEAMAALAGRLVARYGPGGSFWAAYPELPAAPVRSWQVWNEPNTTQFWATGPDPAGYTRMLRATAAAIRAADPAAEVVAAGLPTSPEGMPAVDFLRGMYDAGARGAFDTLAIHPYARDAEGALDLLRAARRELDRLGDPQRRIWATEFGWASAGPPSLVTTSESSQATRVRDAIVLMARARAALRLRGLIVFRWRDVPLNAGQLDSWPLNTGLLRKDGSPKPALGLFRDAAALWHREPELRLRISRRVRRGRLFVRVQEAPGDGSRRVRISYRALRDGIARVRRTRAVATHRRVATVVFKLPRSARSAELLRIAARQGAVEARSSLRLRPRVSRPSAG